MHVYAHLCIPSLIHAWQYTVQMQCKLLATSASGWNRTSSSCLCSCAPLHHTSTIAVICYATKSATISTSAICPKHCAMQQRNIAIGAACQYANTAGACPTSDTYRPEVGVSQHIHYTPSAMQKQHITQITYNIYQLGGCDWPITLPCDCTCSKPVAARYHGICWLKSHMIQPKIQYTPEYIHSIHTYHIYAICKAHDTRLTSLPGLSTMSP